MSAPGLKSFQTVIEPNTLYRARARASQSLTRTNESSTQLRPNIEAFGGDPIDLYASQILPDVAPTGMPKMFDDLAGIAPFTVVPNYIYAATTGDAPDAITLTGVEVSAIMQIAADVEIETFVDANLSLIPPQDLEADVEIEIFVDAPLSLT